MMLLNPPILVMILLPILLVIVGFVLSKCINSLHETSIATLCLFAFAPAMMFYQGTLQDVDEPDFIMGLWFVLYHTAGLMLLAYITLLWLKIGSNYKNLCLLNILILSIFSLRGIQPFLGDPAQAVQTINLVMFIQFGIIASIGVLLSVDQDKSVLSKLLYIFKSPLLYVLILGLIISDIEILLPFEILSVIDSMFKTTLHIALLLMGILLGKYVLTWPIEKASSGFWLAIAFCLVFRLVVSPALALLITNLMGFESVFFQRNLILASGVPTGLFAAVLVCFYGQVAERRFTVLVILFGSVLSYGSLSLWYYCLAYWYPI